MQWIALWSNSSCVEGSHLDLVCNFCCHSMNTADQPVILCKLFYTLEAMPSSV